MNKKILPLFAAVFLILGLSLVSAALCKGTDGVYRSCDYSYKYDQDYHSTNGVSYFQSNPSSTYKTRYVGSSNTYKSNSYSSSYGYSGTPTFKGPYNNYRQVMYSAGDYRPSSYYSGYGSFGRGYSSGYGGYSSGYGGYSSGYNNYGALAGLLSGYGGYSGYSGYSGYGGYGNYGSFGGGYSGYSGYGGYGGYGGYYGDYGNYYGGYGGYDYGYGYGGSVGVTTGLANVYVGW